MKNRLPIITLFLLLALLPSCKQQQSSFPSSASVNAITIAQGEQTKLLQFGYQSIILKKSPFSIQFSNQLSEKGKFPTLQVAAVPNSEQLDKVGVGMTTNDVPFYSPGTGMAASRSHGYESLIIRNNAHHYLYYDFDDTARISLLEQNDNQYKFAFSIDKIYQYKEDIPIEDVDLDRLHLVIFIDRNANKIIDKQELTKVIVILR